MAKNDQAALYRKSKIMAMDPVEAEKTVENTNPLKLQLKPPVLLFGIEYFSSNFS